MASFSTGQPWDAPFVKNRVKVWKERWDSNDPFSSLVVSKNEDDKLIGHVVLGYDQSNSGNAELAYIFDNKFWNQGYGKEAVVPVVKEYAPTLIKKGYKVGTAEFNKIIATTRDDNKASIKILEKAGLKKSGEEKSSGHMRYTFFANTADLVQQFSNDKHSTDTPQDAILGYKK
jgi:RimJ/RimL family protein N-acetyltransferase